MNNADSFSVVLFFAAGSLAVGICLILAGIFATVERLKLTAVEVISLVPRD